MTRALICAALLLVGCEGTVRYESRPVPARSGFSLFMADVPVLIDSVWQVVSGDTLWVSPVRIVTYRGADGSDSLVRVVGQRMDHTLAPFRARLDTLP